MQVNIENNNFQTIISTWRRLSGEQIESTTLVSMSGDSPDYELYKKKEEEANLLIPERSKAPLAIAGADVAAATVEAPPENVGTNLEEKQEFPKFERDDSKDGSGDTKEKEDKSDRDDDDYLENKNSEKKSPDSKCDKDNYGDNVDSVYLRRPPPHKARSAASSVEEKDCCIDCLYYTIQCCDCVLM